MIQARLKISDRANHVLNIVKAKYDLKDKSAALDKLAAEYEEKILEPQFKPEFIEAVIETEKEPLIGPFKNMGEFQAYLDNLPEKGE
jgi:hypothetical protein